LKEKGDGEDEGRVLTRLNSSVSCRLRGIQSICKKSDGGVARRKIWRMKKKIVGGVLGTVKARERHKVR
jgi:hypothetical protein